MVDRCQCRCRRVSPFRRILSVLPSWLLLYELDFPLAGWPFAEHRLVVADEVGVRGLEAVLGELPPVVCFDHHPHSGCHALDHEHAVAIGRSLCNRPALSSARRRHHGLPITASNASRSAMAMPRHCRQNLSECLIFSC
jgi:hypothetical protein